MLKYRRISKCTCVPCAAVGSTATTLLLLRGSLDPSNVLASGAGAWDPSTSYCTWRGVTCNGAQQVTGL